MDIDLPLEVRDFEKFLERNGCAPNRLETFDEHSGYYSVQRFCTGFTIRLERDRFAWVVDVCDSIGRPDKWYQVSLIAKLLSDRNDEMMSFSQQLEFAEAHWLEIGQCLDERHQAETHDRLTVLAKERAKRMFPAWADAVLDLESFLIEKGLACQSREAPEGSFGDRLMQYADASIGVRITCTQETGWRIAIADMSRPADWYDVALIRCALEGTEDKKLIYAKRFLFVKECWTQIPDLFSDQCRESTHARLQQLRAKAD